MDPGSRAPTRSDEGCKAANPGNDEETSRLARSPPHANAGRSAGSVRKRRRHFSSKEQGTRPQGRCRVESSGLEIATALGGAIQLQGNAPMLMSLDRDEKTVFAAHLPSTCLFARDQRCIWGLGARSTVMGGMGVHCVGRVIISTPHCVGMPRCGIATCRFWIFCLCLFNLLTLVSTSSQWQASCCSNA